MKRYEKPQPEGGNVKHTEQASSSEYSEEKSPTLLQGFKHVFQKGTVAREITADGHKNGVLSPTALVFSQLPAIMVVFQQYNL